ncbi:hypothetical protein ACHAXT_008651 [Thalassiosira profunda]
MDITRDITRRRRVGRGALLFFMLIPLILMARPASAAGILTDVVSSAIDWVYPPEERYIDDDFETKTLNIVEISEMRARDIKRRLARKHGYGADELGRMIDKKDLINALSYAEHKEYQQETDRRKWIRFKTTVIYTCVAVMGVMFWPLVRQAVVVARVNFEVYTDRRKHEMGRCRDLQSWKGYFGIFLLFVIDGLSLWLSTSVLLSWVMSSKWFFPTPNIPVRPAQLLTPTGGDPGALGRYGINVGPMAISWLFRFINGRVETFIGKAMSDAVKKAKRKEKDALKKLRKEERAREKEARREAKRQAKEAKKAREAQMAQDSDSEDGDGDSDGDSDGDASYCGMTASNLDSIRRTPMPTSVNFDELD